MALDVYFAEDIRNGIIATTAIAVRTCAANGMANVDHIRGILDHAQAQAALYGIPWPSVIAEVCGALGADLQGLLGQAASRAIVQR